MEEIINPILLDSWYRDSVLERILKEHIEKLDKAEYALYLLDMKDHWDAEDSREYCELSHTIRTEKSYINQIKLFLKERNKK